MSEERKTTSVRLREATRLGLERAAFVLQMSQSALMEQALTIWLKEHHFLKRYQLEASKGHVILTEIDADDIRIKDIQQRNGVPVEQIAREYSEKLSYPVKVISEDR